MKIIDYRNILATGFMLLCAAVFVHSLKSANALPTPQVSMGSNPYESSTGCNSSNPLFHNVTQQDFMITDIVGTSGWLNLTKNGASFFYLPFTSTNSSISLKSPLKVAPGEVVNCSSNGTAFISGYYAHP